MKPTLPAPTSPPAGPPTEGTPCRVPPPRAVDAFTLIEMLVVMGIIAILLAIVLPNIHGFREGHEMDSAARQLTADLNLARAKAIGGRTTVAVVFIPPGLDPTVFVNPLEKNQVSQLQGGMCSQYALYSLREAGDQPGRNTARYLTRWQNLPERTFIAPIKFSANYSMMLSNGAMVQIPAFFTCPGFLFPFDTNFTFAVNPPLPWVAYNCDGLPTTNLVTGEPSFTDARIPLTRGAVLPTLDPGGNLTGYSMTETPPGNYTNAYVHVLIDGATGRAKIERREVAQ